MGELEGKVALVTGAGAGMGVGIALAFAKAGAAVGLLGLVASELEETAQKIAAVGGRSLVLACDITRRDQVDAAVAALSDAFGPVWTLVNNAIATVNKPIEEVDDANLDLVLRTGVYGSLYCMQACFPAMKQHGGRIINFGSGGATMGMASTGAYSIAKEGVRGLTKTAATGWGKYNITVNTVCPSVRTELYRIWEETLTQEEIDRNMAEVPMRRYGDAEQDIGATCVFLAGPGASFITSRTIHVDGGRSFYDR